MFGSRPPGEDPLRRIALVATLLAVPVLVALVVLVHVTGGAGRTPGAVAAHSGSGPQHGDLPVLPVDTAPPGPDADADCPGLLSRLPPELADAPARPVRSVSPYVRAWGEPAVVLVCGVDRPAGFTPAAGLLQINAVQWYVDTSDPQAVVWTAVDRPVYVQVRLPVSADSAAVTELTPAVAALPARAPQPAR